MITETEQQEQQGLDRTHGLFALQDAIECFREKDNQMQAQVMVAFLAIARNPGCTVSRVQDATKMSMPSISRAVSVLAKRYTLVEKVKNPANERETLCMLTPNGERFANTLARLVG